MKYSNPPDARSLMATARSFGNYDLAAALADLIDNSIQAKAKKVTILFRRTNNDVTVFIRDDGIGMAESDLIIAMRPASSHPDQQRDKDDLGRFGWGLKSASLSQARILTVVSWTEESCTAARWNIDDLDNWAMDLFTGDEALRSLGVSPKTKSGTEIIWNNCDRLLDSGVDASIDERLNEKITYAYNQLALIFHRYLSGECGRNFTIEMQERRMEPLDPFMSSHPATQTIDEEKIKIGGKDEITVKPFVIPHFSKLTVSEKISLGGEEGFVRNQGFYVYRNKRLIVYGTWFRLIPHGELTQLTRIRIDLPNTMDMDWKISLDKSDVQLPATLGVRLKQLANKFTKRSKSANHKKGADLTLNKKEPVWRKSVSNGRIRYQINRKHPMILKMTDEIENTDINHQVLNMIESYIPVDSMIKDRESIDLESIQSITDTESFNPLLDCFIACIDDSGGSKKRLKEFLDYAKNIEPFSSHWKYSETYISSKLMEKWNLKNG